MKDTYCDYCRIPETSPVRFNTSGYTKTTLSAYMNFDEYPNISLGVFHYKGESQELIHDGHFDIPIKYCPFCGRSLCQ